VVYLVIGSCPRPPGPLFLYKKTSPDRQRVHLITASPPDDDAGSSGLDPHEVLQLLGLNTSDSEKEETTANSCDDPEDMPCRDEDDLCQEALDRFERQRAFQTHLLH